MFDRGDSSHECLNRETHNYDMWQPFLVRYHTRGKGFLSLLSLARTEYMCHDCLKDGLCLSFFSNSYFFVCYFIHYDKSNIFTPVFKTASSSIATCYKTCKFKEYNDYLITFMFLLYFNSSDLPELRVHYSCRIIGGTHSTCRCWMIYSLSKVT
jgi:hypothetical protein